MRRYSIIMLCVLVVLIMCAMPVLAVQSVDLYIDGKMVPKEPNIYYNIHGSNEGTYFMDVEPELKDGRVYVPIRVISKFWGADIEWQKPDIYISIGGDSLKITINNKSALKNSTLMALDAPPYIKDGRTMVPLRFIAEAFGAEVNYASGKVTILTGPFELDGNVISSLQSRIRMTMGGIINETKTDVCIRGMYRLFINNMGAEIPVPDSYGETVNIDIPDYYYMMNEYSFLDSDSHLIGQFKIYQLLENSYITEEYGITGINYGDYLIYDAIKDKWYKYTQEALDDIADLSSIGEWLEISNTVV